MNVHINDFRPLRALPIPSFESSTLPSDMTGKRKGVFCGENLLFSLTISSVVLGVLLGIALRNVELSADSVRIVNFPGEMFMRILKMMVLPLIFASIISALGQMDASDAGRMGLIAVAYYVTTAVIASALGIFLVLLIQPGRSSIPTPLRPLSSGDLHPLDSFFDLIRNMFPDNIFEATFQRWQTVYDDGRTRSLAVAPGTNILGVIIFCTFFGVVVSRLGDRVRVVVDLFVALDAIIMEWIGTLMWFTPIGIISLISSSLIEVDDLTGTLQMYKTMLEPFFVALGTASSGAAIPTSIHCLEQKFGMDSRVANFVPPLGSTINMDGNALYEAVAVIFIAQLNNVELSLVNVITISLTATLSSMGSGSVPAGLVTLLVVLHTVGLPVKDVPLVVAVDWLIDRVRMAINVMGDGFAAGVVSHWMGRGRVEGVEGEYSAVAPA